MGLLKNRGKEEDVISINGNKRKESITQRDLIEILVLRKRLAEARREVRGLRQELRSKKQEVRMALVNGFEVEMGLHEAKLARSLLIIR